MKHTILLLGANGQLGQSIKEKMHADDLFKLYNIIYSDIEDLDITDEVRLSKKVEDNRIDYIINTAAYTAVDLAEKESGKAFLINEKVPGNLAAISKEKDIFLIHISTDYVFDGIANQPYKTTDPVCPTSVYGQSKAAGEKAILEAGGRGVIIRTSWLYSPYGHNFAKTMISLGRDREEINVVNDQFGRPTFALDLAGAIFSVIDKAASFNNVDTLHYANEGIASWYDFAKEILTRSGSPCRVNPVRSDEFPTIAKRPQYSVLDLSETKNKLSISIPDWRESLRTMLDQYLAKP